MTSEIWFSILRWSSLGTCYLSPHCSGGRLVIFSWGLKSRFRGVSLPAKWETNWQEDGEIKDAAQKYDGFTPKYSYQYIKILVSQKLLEKSSTGHVSSPYHVTLIWNITLWFPSTHHSSVWVGHISRNACKEYTFYVMIYRNVTDHPKYKNTFFLLPEVLFIHLDSFGVSCTVSKDTGHKDACLLSNLMEVDGTPLVLAKEPKR